MKCIDFPDLDSRNIPIRISRFSIFHSSVRSKQKKGAGGQCATKTWQNFQKVPPPEPPKEKQNRSCDPLPERPRLEIQNSCIQLLSRVFNPKRDPKQCMNDYFWHQSWASVKSNLLPMGREHW